MSFMKMAISILMDCFVLCSGDIHPGLQLTVVPQKNIAACLFNGKESTVNRALGGSTYPG
jgi:hypothetical protein